MAILQALFAFITRSAGKILNAVFGWAVHALFGQTAPGQQTVLSAVVGAAVLWPLLLVGVIAPKVAALLIAFVPIPHSVPSWIIRVVWIALALLVPISVGIAITAKAPPLDPPESALKKFLRGFPITLGLATAFLIMFVSVPVMRLVALARGRKTADVPLIIKANSYHQIALDMVNVLNAHGFAMRKAFPGWWVRAPLRILAWFGGDAFRKFVPDNLEHYESPDLAVSFYTSGVLLTGLKRSLTVSHGLISEAAVRGDAFLTMDAVSQRLETQVRRVWEVYEQHPAGHRNSSILESRVSEIAEELMHSDIEYDDWQVVYRQLLQLDRAIRGQGQLLEVSDSKVIKKEAIVPSPTPEHQTVLAPAPPVKNVAEMSTVDLIKEITGQVGLLAKTQIDLAKTELKADLKSEVAMVSGLGIAALAGITTLNMLVVTAILALAQKMPTWQAGFIASGVFLVIAILAASIGWNKRVRRPLEKTRRTLKEDAQWTKERLA